MKFNLPNQITPTLKSSHSSSSERADVRKIVAAANSEIEAILQEKVRLESVGKLDTEASKNIETHLENVSAKLNKNLADQISHLNIHALIPKKHRGLPKLLRIPAVAALVFISSGPLLEMSVGSRFIFSSTNEYRAAMPWMFGVLIPVFAAIRFVHERSSHPLRDRYPTWAVRWLIMFPIIVLFSSTMAVVSPLGWAAVAGWAIGSPIDHLEARIVSIDTPSRRYRGCSQYAQIEFDSSIARICVEDRLFGAEPEVGEKVDISGRLSRLGLLINRIERSRVTLQ